MLFVVRVSSPPDLFVRWSGWMSTPRAERSARRAAGPVASQPKAETPKKSPGEADRLKKAFAAAVEELEHQTKLLENSAAKHKDEKGSSIAGVMTRAINRVTAAQTTVAETERLLHASNVPIPATTQPVKDRANKALHEQAAKKAKQDTGAAVDAKHPAGAEADRRAVEAEAKRKDEAEKKKHAADEATKKRLDEEKHNAEAKRKDEAEKKRVDDEGQRNADAEAQRVADAVRAERDALGSDATRAHAANVEHAAAVLRSALHKDDVERKAAHAEATRKADDAAKKKQENDVKQAAEAEDAERLRQAGAVSRANFELDEATTRASGGDTAPYESEFSKALAHHASFTARLAAASAATHPAPPQSTASDQKSAAPDPSAAGGDESSSESDSNDSDGFEEASDRMESAQKSKYAQLTPEEKEEALALWAEDYAQKLDGESPPRTANWQIMMNAHLKFLPFRTAIMKEVYGQHSVPDEGLTLESATKKKYARELIEELTADTTRADTIANEWIVRARKFRAGIPHEVAPSAGLRFSDRVFDFAKQFVDEHSFQPEEMLELLRYVFIVDIEFMERAGVHVMGATGDIFLSEAQIETLELQVLPIYFRLRPLLPFSAFGAEHTKTNAKRYEAIRNHYVQAKIEESRLSGLPPPGYVAEEDDDDDSVAPVPPAGSVGADEKTAPATSPTATVATFGSSVQPALARVDAKTDGKPTSAPTSPPKSMLATMAYAAAGTISRTVFGSGDTNAAAAEKNPMHPSQFLLKRHQRGPRRA
jgi:hypothetical protein